MEASSRAWRIVLTEEHGRYVVRNPGATAASFLAVLGAALAAVGLADLALLWLPSSFGNASWEFAAVTRTLAVIPMTGLGLALIAYRLLRHPGVRPAIVRGAGVFFLALAAALIGVGVIYAYAAPVVVAAAEPNELKAMQAAIVKTSIAIIVYALAFGVIARMLWRAVRQTR